MADPSVEYLYETPDTGKLLTDAQGRASRGSTAEYQGASLSGPQPRFASPGPSDKPTGPLGIGGSSVTPSSVPHPDSAPRMMTPDEMMSLANKMEQEYADRLRNSDGPSARRLSGPSESNSNKTELTSGAESVFGRSGYDTGEAGRAAFAMHQPAPQQYSSGVPDWLNQFMDKQPSGGTITVDPLGYQRYISEREKLKNLKAKRPGF